MQSNWGSHCLILLMYIDLTRTKKSLARYIHTLPRLSALLSPLLVLDGRTDEAHEIEAEGNVCILM